MNKSKDIVVREVVKDSALNRLQRSVDEVEGILNEPALISEIDDLEVAGTTEDKNREKLKIMADIRRKLLKLYEQTAVFCILLTITPMLLMFIEPL